MLETFYNAYLFLDKIAYCCDVRSDVCSWSSLPYCPCRHLCWTDAFAFASVSSVLDFFWNGNERTCSAFWRTKSARWLGFHICLSTFLQFFCNRLCQHAESFSEPSMKQKIVQRAKRFMTNSAFISPRGAKRPDSLFSWKIYFKLFVWNRIC